MKLGNLFLISTLLVSCASDNSGAYNDFNKIGTDYSKKYIVAEHFDHAEFLELKKILLNKYGLFDIGNFDELLCKDKNEGLLKNPLTLKYVKQRLVIRLFLDDQLCKENMGWYLQRIGVSQNGINPFIEVVATDKIYFFEGYLSAFSYEEIFSSYPNLHIYAAFRKSCNIVKKLYEDRNKASTLNSVLESNSSYGAYVKGRCGMQY